jgi:hypothetical protein
MTDTTLTPSDLAVLVLALNVRLTQLADDAAYATDQANYFATNGVDHKSAERRADAASFREQHAHALDVRNKLMLMAGGAS